MANPGYMSIKGVAQGLISAGCSTPESIGNKYQSSHTDEIMVLSYRHNLANIGTISKPTHSPIVITKAIDKSSPLLAQALSSREEINCTISFYRVSSFGLQEKFYSVSINGAVIVDLTSELPHVVLQGDAEPQEQLAIRYREITWTLGAGTFVCGLIVVGVGSLTAGASLGWAGEKAGELIYEVSQ